MTDDDDPLKDEPLGDDDIRVDPFGEKTLPFDRAVLELEYRASPTLSRGAAQKAVREACASGEVRAWEAADDMPMSRIPPADWRTSEPDLAYEVLVSTEDFEHWLPGVLPETKEVSWEELLKQHAVKPPAPAPTPKRAERGKRPRIKALLAKDFPTKDFPKGVPEPAFCPRKELIRKLLKAEPTLAPLDEDTLKKAIDEYNAGL
jgi:hypothetical protein